MADYDLDSIFGRTVLSDSILFFNREKDFKECGDDDERLGGLLVKLRLVSRLDEAVEGMELTAYQEGLSSRWGRVVLRQLARNYRRVKEGERGLWRKR